jgi:CopA family copper-resistance protein
MSIPRALPPTASPAIDRRRFVQGIAAAGGLLLSDGPLRQVLAAASQPVLRGTQFALEIGPMPINITRRPRTAAAINGQLPGPILRWREGDSVTLAVSNRLSEPTSIHWHGIRTPSSMDGVPGLSFPGIAPGETFTYRFLVPQSGTYWYHSHSRFQEQTGVYGPIVIEPRGGYAQRFDRDYVVMLSDWSDESPDTIVGNIKFDPDYYNFHQRTIGTFFDDVGRDGLGATVSDRLMWAGMRMSPTDILDVTGATYTYLVNGQPPDANWTALFRPGEGVRLRFINGSSMTIFDVGIPNLPMTIIQADGNDIEPVTVDQFRIGVAETYDVIVQPKADRAYTIFAQAEDRSGYARGTLAPHPGMTAAIPPMDPRPMRTMTDMGMGGMDHGSMAGMNMDQGSRTQTEHGSMPGMGHGSMPGMQMNHGSMPGMQMDQSGMAHAAGPWMAGMAAGTSTPPLTRGVEVDNVAEMPTERLNTPGEGFPPGLRVLTYTDLRAARPGIDPRPPSREITLHLTGNMDRFIWGFDGKKFSEAEPIVLQRGERVRFVLINDTMMEHPIHLHGLWSELENGHGEYRPYKHTINVKGGEKLSFLVNADHPGRWAFHCHLLYHMEMGMFREVRVA